MDAGALVSGAVEGLNLSTLDAGSVIRAALTVLVGTGVIRVLTGMADRALARSKSLSALRGHIRTGIRAGLWFLLVMLAAEALGIKMTSLIALVSVAGVAVSLALQSTLANLAGGLMLLASKPFEVGDYVEADGVSGTVSAIGLAYSTLDTPDNKEIFIPNSQIAAARIINYNRLGTRRLELTFTAGYAASAGEVRAAVQEAMEQFPQLLPDPAPAVYVSEYGPGGVEYVVRAWTSCQDYWDVYYGLNEAVRPAFARRGIEMTCNHVNVHTTAK